LNIRIGYDALSEHYETEDAGEMAAIDQANYRENVNNFTDLLAENTSSISVVPTEVIGQFLTPEDFRGLTLSKIVANKIADIYLEKTRDINGADVIRQCGSQDTTNKGIINKYTVIRNDGSEKHANCEYFVLDMNCDKFAKPAILAYSKACENEFPLLSVELRECYG
jgi:hypothetical protein